MQENDLSFTITSGRNILEWGTEDVLSWIQTTCFSSDLSSSSSADHALALKLKFRLHASAVTGQDIVTDDEATLWDKMGIGKN